MRNILYELFIEKKDGETIENVGLINSQEHRETNNKRKVIENGCDNTNNGSLSSSGELNSFFSDNKRLKKNIINNEIENNLNITFNSLIEKLKVFYMNYKKLAENQGDMQGIIESAGSMLGFYEWDHSAIKNSLVKISKLNDKDFYKAFNKNEKLKELKETLDCATKPSNSCGDISTRTGSLILEEPLNFTLDLKNKFDVLSSENKIPFMNKIKILKGPHVMRVEILRYEEENKNWVGSHSYLVLVDDKSQACHVFQAYANNFTLQEWLADQKYTFLMTQTLENHLDDLYKLHCGSVRDSKRNHYERGKIYSKLFCQEGAEVPSVNYPIKVCCGIQKLDLQYAFENINLQEDMIEKSIIKYRENSLNKSETVEDFLSKGILLMAGFEEEESINIVSANNRLDRLEGETIEESYRHGYY